MLKESEVTRALEKYKELLFQLDILSSSERKHKFHVDVSGYEKFLHYPEFRFRDYLEYPIDNFIHIDKIDYSPNYGFLIDDEKVKGQANSTIKIESITPDPFEEIIVYDFVISGDPKDIDIITLDFLFEVELIIEGCLKTELFWKHSLYLGYLMLKKNNIISCFMHLFITFEGMIRSRINDESNNVNQIYKLYTNESLPDYLDAYRKIRNKVMHGNENLASCLTVEDIDVFIETIDSLELNRTRINTFSYTEAIERGLAL